MNWRPICAKCGSDGFNHGAWYCGNENCRAPISNAGVQELKQAERDFLDASVLVWREIDHLSAQPDGYKGLDSSTDLRVRERAAWNKYRDVLASHADRELSG